jgi:type III restriction enzyme
MTMLPELVASDGSVAEIVADVPDRTELDSLPLMSESVPFSWHSRAIDLGNNIVFTPGAKWDRFKDGASIIRIPIFYLKTESSRFTLGDTTPLMKEALVKGFTLRDKEITINFETADSEIYKVDVEGSGDTTPKYEKLSSIDRKNFKGYFDDYVEPGDVRISACKKEVSKYLNRIDSISSAELNTYSDRVIDNMSKDNLSALLKAPQGYVKKIKDKIILLESEYCEQKFYKMVDSGEIICVPHYALPNMIHPIKCTNSIAKSLYNSEGDMNNLEFSVITQIASLENVKWWHRILDHGGNSSFHLNGFINHYPDFIVMTNNGTLVLVETKGADRDNTDSKRKLKLGKVWENRSGLSYRYFMVVEGQSFDVDGAHHIDDFIEIMKKL